MPNQDLAKQRAELATEAYAALSSITPHKVVPSGSYFICGTLNTDIDFFLLHHKGIESKLSDMGFSTKSTETEYEDDGGRKFVSFRKGDINAILVFSEKALNDIEKATNICREKNVTDKNERIRIFQEVSPSTQQYQKWIKVNKKWLNPFDTGEITRYYLNDYDRYTMTIPAYMRYTGTTTATVTRVPTVENLPRNLVEFDIETLFQ